MFPVSLRMSFGLCQDPTQDPTGHIVVVSPWSPLIYDRCLVSVLHNGDTLEKYRSMVTYLVEWPSVWACLMFPHSTVETVADFIFLGFKISADGDCSHEIERHLLLGRKVMTNLDSILKRRDITLSTKVHLVKAMVLWSCMDVS